MLFTGKNYKVRKREEETPRINALKKRFLSDKFYVDIQRARIVTESYKKSEGYPMVIRRAMAFKDIMENLDCVIQDNELIVGAQNGSSNRSASVFPDSRVDFIRDEIDIFETRAADRFIVRPEVKKERLEDIITYWEDKCLHSNMLKTLPDETRRHQLAENQCVNGWCAFANGPGHYVPDHENLLKMGLKGKKEQAEKVLAEIDMCDKEGIRKMHDLQAMIMTIDAAITFAHRYAAKAREMAEKEADETRKKELIRIAETCEWVPENPPRNFYEATQFVWFTELITQIETNGVSIAPGNFDRYMLPYYEKDIADGTETQESIAEILGCFYIKLAEMVVLYDTQQSTFIANFAMGEHLSIGGTDKYGRDVTNELSYVCLQAQMDVGLFQPNMSVRWHNKCPDNLLKEGLRVVSVRNAIPQIINDEVFVESILSRGVPMEEAREYACAGCSEVQLPGKTASLLMIWVSDLKVLENALNNGRDMMTGKQFGPKTGEVEEFTCIEDVIHAYEEQLKYYYKQAAIMMNTEADVHRRVQPLPWMSVTNGTCIEKGTEIWRGGAKYYWTSMIALVGMANVGNSIAAIKKVCFDDKLYTLREVMDACKVNFEGHEDMRQVLLNVDKFGNDIEWVDKITVDMMNLSYELGQKYVDDNGIVHEFKDPRGGELPRSMWPSYLTVSANTAYGKYCGASPDGRLATTPCSDSICPTQGSDSHGLTAMLNSMAQLDQTQATGGVIFNVKFSPDALSTEEALDDTVEVVKSYFRNGGAQIQFQVTSHKTLRRAQEHPEQYGDLMVRITGYAALFTEITPEVQEELISRTQYEELA